MFSLRFISTSLVAVALALAAVAARAQDKLQPNQINWPTGASGCVYAPGTNTCVSPGSGSAFSGGLGTSYQDVTEIPAPGNPSGHDRLYLDSTSHQLSCLTSAGANCMPSPGAGVAAIPVVIDTSTPVTVSTTNNAEYHFNRNATAATAIVYNLPTAAAGKQFCMADGNNGSAADTGTLTLQTSATGQFITYTDGTLTASDGFVISGGAAGDAACVVGIDSTHWMLYVQRGTWTKH